MWACALAVVAADAGSARAAWDNVFQVCCQSCRSHSYSSNYAPAAVAAAPCCPQPCCPPPPTCTTRYVQRCYYQPVTCYQTKTYYEPVTTYRTSYYYEPVTSYRYSSYYDPCTGCSHQVSCPQTSYRLRSQCCPVQSWVQRCAQVPVTSYRMSSYWEPVTTCCTPTCYTAPAAPAPCCNTPAQPSYAAPAQPGVAEQRAYSSPPAVQETPGTKSGSPLYDRYYPPQSKEPPAAKPSGTIYRQPAPALPVSPPPAVRLDRIVSLPKDNIQGQVVASNNLPAAGTQVVFVSTSGQTARQAATADRDGNFRVTLASGGWYVYVQGKDNKPVFHSKIDVRHQETQRVTVVSR